MKIFSKILTVFVLSLSFFSYSFFTYDEDRFCPRVIVIVDDDGVIWFTDEPAKIAELKKQKEEREKLKDVGNLMSLILQEDLEEIEKVLKKNPELMLSHNSDGKNSLRLALTLNPKLFNRIFLILFKYLSEEDFLKLKEKCVDRDIENIFDVFCLCQKIIQENNSIS